MKTAAIYTRKSIYTGIGESIENQVSICKEYLKRFDINNFTIYEDEGYSGKNSDRPQFQKMLKDAKAKKFDVLICYRLDRVSRNIADFSTLIQELEKYNISFVSVTEQFDTGTPLGRAMMYIASVFSQLERETIAERVRDNMLELAKSGRWLGGMTATGYESKKITYFDADFKERTLYELTPIEEELDLVRLIFNKYLEYKSLSQVVKYLLSSRIMTKLNNDWTKTQIKTILNNPVYVKATKDVFSYLEDKGISVVGKPDGEHGMLTYNKRKGKTGYKDISDWVCAVSKHKGIIDADKWIDVQKTLESNKEKAPRLGRTTTALLTGIIRCAKCGHHMRVTYGKKSKSTGLKPFYYACSMKHDSGGTRCKNKNVNGEKLERVVIEKLKGLTYDKGKLIKELENYKNELSTNSLIKTQVDNIANSIKQNNSAIENLVSTISMTTDEESSKILLNKLKELSTEKQTLENQLREYAQSKCNMDNEILNIDITIESLKNFSSLIDSCNNEEKRLLLASVIDKLFWDGETSDIKMYLWGADKKK